MYLRQRSASGEFYLYIFILRDNLAFFPLYLLATIVAIRKSAFKFNYDFFAGIVSFISDCFFFFLFVLGVLEFYCDICECRIS